MKKSTERIALLADIQGGDYDGFFDEIVDAMASRRKFLARQLFLDLKVGDRVQIGDHIKPKYMAGLFGTVVEKKESKVEVEFPQPVGRFGRRVLVPTSCLRPAFLRKDED